MRWLASKRLAGLFHDNGNLNLSFPLLVLLVALQWRSRRERVHVRHTCVAAGLSLIIGLGAQPDHPSLCPSDPSLRCRCKSPDHQPQRRLVVPLRSRHRGVCHRGELSASWHAKAGARLPGCRLAGLRVAHLCRNALCDRRGSEESSLGSSPLPLSARFTGRHNGRIASSPKSCRPGRSVRALLNLSRGIIAPSDLVGLGFEYRSVLASKHQTIMNAPIRRIVLSTIALLLSAIGLLTPGAAPAHDSGDYQGRV